MMKNIRKNIPPGAPMQDYVTGLVDIRGACAKGILASLFEA